MGWNGLKWYRSSFTTYHIKSFGFHHEISSQKQKQSTLGPQNHEKCKVLNPGGFPWYLIMRNPGFLWSVSGFLNWPAICVVFALPHATHHHWESTHLAHQAGIPGSRSSENILFPKLPAPLKLLVDPISMSKTLGVQQWWLYKHPLFSWWLESQGIYSRYIHILFLQTVYTYTFFL